MIRAAFFDIDGTLVSFRTHEISAKSLESLRKLREKGVRLFIASGRHLLIMDNLADFPFDGYVCMNGALIFVGGKVIWRHPLDAEDAADIIGEVERRSIPCAAFCENSVVMNCCNDVARRAFEMIRLPIPELTPLKAAESSPIYQMTVFVDRREEEEYLSPLMRRTSSTRWHPAFTDLIPDDLSKAEGIDRVISQLGIGPDEVIAFGDGGNDIEMLRYAGIGVAMGNAADDVKANADYVTSSVDEEGVAAALEHFGLI